MSMNEKNYLGEIISTEKVTVIQILKLLSKESMTIIKPNNHRTYYEGASMYVPKEFYNSTVIDISIYDYEIGIFIDSMQEWDKIADEKELRKINKYYNDTVNSFKIYNE